ncbi:unnamed protein product [Dibothriocephalus latus]|uniref:Reverse transcriptase domain-containing protein n=1 Tax=Dibothriocephalus latus TaxID=60516 RepID=A0A3P7LNL5_DIBLA|nr:unnamed protein product [Dibothriocephalus latus]
MEYLPGTLCSPGHLLLGDAPEPAGKQSSEDFINALLPNIFRAPFSGSSNGESTEACINDFLEILCRLIILGTLRSGCLTELLLTPDNLFFDGQQAEEESTLARLKYMKRGMYPSWLILAIMLTPGVEMEKEGKAISGKDANWLAQHLKKLTEGSEHTAVSSTHFLENLKKLKITPDKTMLSFDAVSLFTSIPKELAMKVINDLLVKRYEEEEKPLKRKHVMEILEYCLITYFKFNGWIYKQVQRRKREL